jgi:hypothetical protein
MVIVNALNPLALYVVALLLLYFAVFCSNCFIPIRVCVRVVCAQEGMIHSSAHASTSHTTHPPTPFPTNGIPSTSTSTQLPGLPLSRGLAFVLLL